ncbi:3D-(3,5/4)-trihydroxycyclohexane-1,2-dione acylhydrolase (decyclizing) [Albidovulum sp.]|uniref:3D-(3,5/4)-trihydroxycyclohexane-1,2-dione acylhydrolase (decyclizing) n=1 Tax=Albidovulum sp. TaxID=1872424 RepID=UPI002B9B4DFA|nr:3D-(3,5/4)-trihydroxycyclohexane-1,2-dione acylhydrolase (decyclizing) [Defluviimonas sp.]MCP5356255.1 3D-(3,5/4)-trihydroxycyclohexane-1,2-dione acylhydrolase (decyclizing) [Paracoccaceae bacterium]MCP5376941.1 3D-(3,5/4)-trihydroxycyclohexane-1,2-dione acylhydrolase (decyclizing) [Paracoccaceae bacterium]HPE24521.1 3D-(3,5/4)-trihydroxycyclohexane-1,2-dione acylhydrolase (decyclizing) [Albidovulum sp.]
MTTVRLTAAQAMVRWLANQRTESGERFIEGIWAIFGHGNVAGIGEALQAAGDDFPTWRGHNEQTMAHTAIAYAKAMKRQRAMAVTTSIGPGATNLVTAAALAHVNRLPVLLIPGDVFANRAPDPVLQQVEDWGDGTVSANDCFRPVSRYFDRISRPEHILTALPRALRVMTDPAECGPVTLAFCQDVQAEAYDYPESFFLPKVWRVRRPEPDAAELDGAIAAIRAAKAPVIVAGGGVIYSGAEETLAAFAGKHGIPVVETQGGKSALAHDHALNFGPVGVTGGAAANAVCAGADLVIGVGTRFQDFTTGSWSLFKNPARRLLSINVQPFDAAKHGAAGLVADAKVALERIGAALGAQRWDAPAAGLRSDWAAATAAVKAAPGPGNALPTDAQVIGAVQRAAGPDTVVMGAAGTMPGELHKIWDAAQGGYHMEYGYSCMGYEVAGALGIKLARPSADVVCMVGDGSYMMANSELATAVMMGVPFTVVLTDNRGYGCINRLQQGCGGAPFNNLLDDTRHVNASAIDFVAHAGAMGAKAVKAADIAGLEAELKAAKGADRPVVIVIDTDPAPSTGAGGHWWDVAVPEVSARAEVNAARARYEEQLQSRRLVD